MFVGISVPNDIFVNINVLGYSEPGFAVIRIFPIGCSDYNRTHACNHKADLIPYVLSMNSD